MLETPSATEIQERIEATPWRTGFDRIGALEDHRLGLLETRAQLEYRCAQVWMSESFPSWARRLGIVTETIVISRGLRARR